MAIILGGVTLSAQMIWSDEVQQDPVAQTALRTVGGRLIIRSQGLTEGRTITLDAVSDQGWLTRAQVDSVIALAAVPAAQYGLTIGAQSFTVVFRHHEPPAATFDPKVFRTDAPGTDWYTGTIKLITV